MLYYLPQYKLTTLSKAGGLTDSETTGIVLSSVAGIDITKPGIALLTYADPLVTSVSEWITYTSINGSNELQGVARGQEGSSAKAHLNGCSIAFPISKSHINNIIDVLHDGWIPVDQTWTYASATTITIPAGGASKYAKGDKIKLTQTTVKYFYIVGVADTLLTVTGGSDYTVANATITLNYYSHNTSPVGFPQTFNTGTVTWDTATIDNGTGGQQPTGAKSFFTINGNVVTHSIELGGSGVIKNATNTYIKFTLPATLPAKNTSVMGTYISMGTVFYPAVVYTGVVVFDNSNTVVEFVVSQGANITDNTSIQSTTASYSYIF